MRIMHTSDWHLGRSFHGVDLLQAQLATLQALVDVCRSESVDAVIIAGDIYDRAIPSADAVAALDHVLAELRATGAVVIGISGNHDSAVRVGFAERVLTNAGVSIRGDIATAGTPVLVPEKSGDHAVAFYPIPYLDPEPARIALDAAEARSHDRLLQVALDRARADLATRSRVRSIAIVHAFVTGGETSDSELALAVGGSAEVGLKNLSGFDYAALGHLHARQSFGKGTARYSGSLLPYSFSERHHVKGIWLVDLPPSGDMTCQPIDLPVFRPLQQLRGTLEELLQSTEHQRVENHFVQAILTDATLPMGAMEKLRRRFPHAVALEHQPPTRESNGASYVDRVKGKTDLELSVDFLEHVTGVEPTDEQVEELTAVIDAGALPGEHQAA
jgi:exonuclease SbcD